MGLFLFFIFESLSSHLKKFASLERLLNLLSTILSGHAFVPPGARQISGKAELRASSSHVRMSKSRFVAGKPFQINLIHLQAPSSQIVLALNVLTNFDFKEHGLSEFVVQVILPHLGDEDANARRSAVISTCKILSRDRIRFQSSQHSLETITQALDKLLSVAIVDTGKILQFSTGNKVF